jgi:threonine aldolase
MEEGDFAMVYNKSFASDNNAGIHPVILKAIEEANRDDVLSYGDDVYSERAIQKIQDQFGVDCDVYFVFNGTGANITGLKAITKSFQAIICADTAHINGDECGAPEQLIGCKLLTISTEDGKITPEQVKRLMHGIGNAHHSQPKVISISQVTEYGTVYTPEEIKALADFAHANDMLLHMDGARLSNAVAALGTGFKEMTVDVGVDVLSFGGTKNGLMIGEAVVFFNKDHGVDFKYIRKQGMQLASKMRFIAAQFEALLTDDLWRENALNANRMGQLLGEELEKFSQIQITQKVESNAVFAIIPKPILEKLEEKYLIAVWSEERSEVRLMASFNTKEEHIREFAADVKEIISGL